MLPSMDKLAAQLAASSFVPPARILLPEDKTLDIYLEAVPSEAGHPARLEGSGFLRTVPQQDELRVQARASPGRAMPRACRDAFDHVA